MMATDQRAEHDPIHMHEGKWYFYDETWTDRYGPYDTEEKAQELYAENKRLKEANNRLTPKPEALKEGHKARSETSPTGYRNQYD